MNTILYLGLHLSSLELLQRHVQVKDVMFQETSEKEVKDAFKKLQSYQVLLLGEKVGNPIRLAQEAYGYDKSISILLLTDSENYNKMKQGLQFSPFIGPTVQCISNGIGAGMAPIVEDAIQRTAQRRSFARLKSISHTKPQFAPNALEKVRTDFTTKVLAEAPIGAVLISGSGIVYSINNYALGLFHRSEKEVLGTSIISFFPRPVQADVKTFLQDGYLSDPKRVFEVTDDENRLYLELSVAPIDMKSSSNYKLLILNNITSTVEAQQRTQAHLQELEKLNENLARANADLDTFVYTASHDLKSPILNIEGLVTSLEHELGAASAAVVMELEHIKRSIRRFKQTVEELTEVSRVQRSFDQEATLVELPEVLEEVMQLMEREIKETEAVIKADFKNTSVFFARRNLTSILYNLISNAIKYRSPDRKPIISIKSWCEQQELCLAVQDNGMGIPAAKQPQVFQLFRRMHSHVQGSGVGLYIVKRLVDNNGGQVMLQSEEGQGTTFLLRLKGCPKSSA